MPVIYVDPNTGKARLKSARRYNPRRIAFVVYAGAKAGYTPGFLTLTARHPTALRRHAAEPSPANPQPEAPGESDPPGDFSAEIRKFNRRISKALYDFLNRTLPQETGKTFTHFLLRSETHENGAFHYHLLVVDWPFTADDWGKIRLAWAKALHRYGLLSDKELENAKEYAARWPYRETVARDVYDLGQRFGGFAKFEPLAEGDPKEFFSSLPRVAAYIAGYIGDTETGGRMRGYGIFRNLVHMHSVLVFLSRQGLPTPRDTDPPRAWRYWWDTTFYPLVRELVALRLSSLSENARQKIYRLLLKIGNQRAKFYPPRGTAFLLSWLRKDEDWEILITRWLYLRRLDTAEKECVANQIGLFLLSAVSRKLHRAKKKAEKAYNRAIQEWGDVYAAASAFRAAYLREARQIYTKAAMFTERIQDFLLRKLPFTLLLRFPTRNKRLELLELHRTIANFTRWDDENWEPPDDTPPLTPCPRWPRYAGVIGWTLEKWLGQISDYARWVVERETQNLFVNNYVENLCVSC